MYLEISKQERKIIKNAEPKKCGGWFWTTIDEIRKEKNFDKLFYPIKAFLTRYPEAKDVEYIKNMIKHF